MNYLGSIFFGQFVAWSLCMTKSNKGKPHNINKWLLSLSIFFVLKLRRSERLTKNTNIRYHLIRSQYPISILLMDGILSPAWFDDS